MHKKKNFFQGALDATVSAFKRVFRWIARAFTGKKMSTPQEGKIQSPSRLVREAFFSKKSALAALFTLVGLFLFVFIAPTFVPMDVNYTDALQQNLAPTYSLRAVPRGLKEKLAEIDGFSGFSVGRNEKGDVFVWGATKDKLYKTDLKNVPQTVQNEGAAFVAAGKDHILTLTKTGKIVGWGDNSCGQYGTQETLNALPMPLELAKGILPERVSGLWCGYQTSALVTTDGKAYLWGNTNAVKNLAAVSALSGVKQVAFTNSVAVALLLDGTVSTGGDNSFVSAYSMRQGAQASFVEFLSGKRAVQIAATGKCVAVLLSDGDVVVTGAIENGENEFPVLKQGEYFTQIDGGARHFVGVTNLGGVYGWGHNAYGQCTFTHTDNAKRVFAGSMQSYVVNGENQLLESVGLKGYLMGTDGRGRDVFARIVHGGKMTMTVGAVAVLVSSVIAIIVGCVAGYFGGFVDTLLMRITEIFSSIPFLPFAMLLSQIIKNYNVSESMRIFIIMLILGALSWTGLARILRGQVLAEREKEFVTAAKALGVKPRTVAFKHILPNVVSVILVSMTLDFAGCLLTESSLSYLGFGVQPPQPTWGNMLNGCNNSTVIQNYWWQWLFPSLFLSVAVICINIVGDALRDALDPKNSR